MIHYIPGQLKSSKYAPSKVSTQPSSCALKYKSLAGMLKMIHKNHSISNIPLMPERTGRVPSWELVECEQ